MKKEKMVKVILTQRNGTVISTMMTKAQKKRHDAKEFMRRHIEIANQTRDFQRQRLYNAERGLMEHNKYQFNTTQDAEKWIKEKIIPILKEDYGISSVKVKDGRGRQSACAYYDRRTISLPRWARTEYVIIHEVAHLPIPDKHGPMFCALYLRLVREIMGAEAAECLEAGYIKEGVKY